MAEMRAGWGYGSRERRGLEGFAVGGKWLAWQGLLIWFDVRKVRVQSENRGVNLPGTVPDRTPVYLTQPRNDRRPRKTALYFGRISVPFFLPLKSSSSSL